MNPIVARFQDGRVLKGFTSDFLPAKDHFHISLQDQPPGAKPLDVRVADLKGLFFVKTFPVVTSLIRITTVFLLTETVAENESPGRTGIRSITGGFG